ncbi:MAG: hypothetical protein JJU11_05570 [Candidatus Sumerlaeia bacterium]|nr:hypothetical protein [Candidatus Sumerlaeia bacterium]
MPDTPPVTAEKRPPKGPARRPLWKRLLRGLAWAFVALFLLLLSLPTIISLLPIEGVISRQVSGIFPGTVEIEKISLGWWAPVAVGRVTLRDENLDADDPAARFLEIHGIALTKGIVPLVTGAARPGPLHVESITVHATRFEDGTFNFDAFIPPPGEEDPAPPPPQPIEPGEPFVLDLAQLLPRMLLPVKNLSMDLRVNHIDVTWDDRMEGSPAPKVTIHNGTFYLGWPGDEAPLGMRFAGILGNGRDEVPLEFATTLSNWSRGDELDFSAFKLTGFLDAGGRANVFDFGAEADDEGLVANWKVTLPALEPLASLFDQGHHIPTAGEIRYTIFMGHLSNGATPVHLSLDVEDVALPAFAAEDSELVMPPIRLKVVSDVDSKELMPRAASLDLDADWMQATASLLEESNGSSPFKFDFQFSAAKAIELADKTTFRDLIPARGDLDVLLTAAGNLVDLEKVEDGSLSLEILPGTWKLNPGLVPPAAMLRTADTVNLAGLSMHLQLEELFASSEEQSGRWQLDFPAFASLHGMFEHYGAKVYTATAEWDVSLEGLEKFASTNIVLEPVLVDLIGKLEGNLEARGAGRTINADMVLALQDFFLRSAFLPEGTMEDSLHVTLQARLMEPFDIDATWDIQTDLLELDGILALKDDLISDVRLHLGLKDLALLQERWIDHFVEPGMVLLEGGLHLDIHAGQANAESWEVSLGLEPDQYFSAMLEQQGILLESWGIQTALRAILGEDSVAVEIDKLDVLLEKALAFAMTGSLAMEGDRVRVDMAPLLTLDHGGLLDLGYLILEEAGVLLEALDGETTLGGTVIADLTMGEVMDGTARVEMALFNDTPQLLLAFPMELLMDGLEVDHRFVVDVTLGEEIVYTVLDEGHVRIGGVMGEFFEGIGLLLENRVEIGTDGSITADIPALRWEALAVAMEGQEPLFIPDGGLGAKISLPGDMSRVEVRDLTFDLGGGLDFIANLVYNMEQSSMVADYNLVRLDLSMVAELLGAMVPVDLAGLVTSNGDISLTLGTAEGSDLPIRDYAIRVDGAIEEGHIANEAVDIRGLESKLAFAFDPDLLRFSLHNDLTLIPPAGDDGGGMTIPISSGMVVNARRTGTMPLEKQASITIEEFSVKSEGLGTDLVVEAHLDNFHPSGRPDDVKPIPIMELGDILLLMDRIPGSFSMRFRQELAPIAAAGYLQEASGSAEIAVGYSMTQGARARLFYTQNFADISLRHNDTTLVNDLSSTMNFERSFFLPGIPPTPPRRNTGVLNLGRASYAAPAMEAVIENAIITVLDDRGRFSILGRAESFLGGTFAMHGELEERRGTQQLFGDFSLTGLDAAVFLPVLGNTPQERREVDIFGTLRFPFVVRIQEGLQSPDSRLVEYLEDIFIRLDISRIEAEVLRGALRNANEDGGVPGAQAVLAALQFSRPDGVDIELRGGLINIGVTMASPGGITYRIPLLERLHIGNYLRPALEDASELSSALVRDYLLMLIDLLEEHQ